MSKVIIIGVPEGVEVDVPAVHTQLYPGCPVAESETFYSLTELVTSSTIYVLKNSFEGIELSKWLTVPENLTQDSTVLLAMQLALPHLSAEDLLAAIDDKCANAFESGKREAQRHLRLALGFNG